MLMKNVLVVYTMLVVAVAGLATQARAWTIDSDSRWGQQPFLNQEFRPLWDERYVNYALLSYRGYDQREVRPTYDMHGYYLLDGVNLLRFEDYRTLSPDRSSRLSRSGQLADFRNLVIMRDHYRNWSTRLMFGTRLPGHLTPLTLSKASYAGIRWDGSSYRNSFTTMTSRVSQTGSGNLPFATYLYAGYWESQLGDVVRLGASYVNLLRRDLQRRSGNLRGAFPGELESADSYFLIISDDSPEDGIGVQIYAVEALIDGQRVDAVPDIRVVREACRVEDVQYVRQSGAWAPRTMTANRLLKRESPGRGRYYTEGIPVQFEGSEPLEVSRTDLLIFRFELQPGNAEPVSFRTRVSGDYSIDVGASFPWSGVPDRAWSDWHNVKRSPGNVQDGSNLGWVTVDYGFPTSILQYGTNVTVNLFDSVLNAEYVRNVGNFQAPFDGDHHQVHTDAFYAKFMRDMGTWRIGGEYFDIPSTFQNELPIWNHSRNESGYYRLIDNNDDGDEWADETEHWDPLDPEYLTQLATPGVDPDARSFSGFGVYPGMDWDRDGVPDYNVNNSRYPDYEEPFLMYHADSRRFAYGDDFNNNGVVDDRENNNRANLPYELDSRGYHVFSIFEPHEDIQVRGGRYRQRQRAGTGANSAYYMEIGYQGRQADFGRIHARYRIRRVRDDIPSPILEFTPNPLSAVNRSIRIQHDMLLMQNSVVNTAYLHAHYDGIPALNIASKTKFDWNELLDDSVSIGDRVIDWVVMGKADYSHEIGSVRVTPKIKFTLDRRWAPDDLLISRNEFEIYPIVRVDYPFTPNVWIRAGVQGWAGFEHQFRDRLAEINSYNARHYVLSFETRGSYTGYETSINIMFKSSRTDFINTPEKRLMRFNEFLVQARVL